MSEEPKEPWLNYLALSTILLAVCATMATFRGGGASTRSVMSQAQASDKWAHYQAKSVKSNLYEMSLATAELELQTRTGMPGGVVAAYEKKLASDRAKVAKYEQEKEQLQAEAKALEKARDDAQRHGREFGIAVIFLQISILLCSIAALLKKKPVWVVGMAVGLVGVVYFLNGFLLFL